MADLILRYKSKKGLIEKTKRDKSQSTEFTKGNEYNKYVPVKKMLDIFGKTRQNILLHQKKSKFYRLKCILFSSSNNGGCSIFAPKQYHPYKHQTNVRKRFILV